MTSIINFISDAWPSLAINLYYEDDYLVIELVASRPVWCRHGYEIGDSTVELKFFGIDMLRDYMKDAGLNDDTRKQAVDELKDTIESFTVADIMRGVTLAPSKSSAVGKALSAMLGRTNE